MTETLFMRVETPDLITELLEKDSELLDGIKVPFLRWQDKRKRVTPDPDCPFCRGTGIYKYYVYDGLGIYDKMESACSCTFVSNKKGITTMPRDSNSITLSDVEAYVKTLNPQMQRAWRDAEDVRLSTRDTLEEDFQISAAISKVFWDKVKEHAEFGIFDQ